MIIGLTGHAGVGKDTVADILVRKHGFKRLAFADPLREMLYALNPIVETYIDRSDAAASCGRIRVREIVDEFGWDKAKRLRPEIRTLLQRLGTEAGRNVLGEDIWTNLALQKIDDWIYNAYDNVVNVVITDCRFTNEAYFVHSLAFGKVVCVVRPGHGPVNSHVSDAGLPDHLVDYVLHNNTDLGYDPEALNIAVADMLEALKCS